MKLKHVVGNLYRGSAPKNSADIAQIKWLEIKQVICLQEGWSWLAGSFKAEKYFEKGGASYHKQSFSNLFFPSKDELEALSKLIDKEPTFVHCRAGVDRTGVLSAYYCVTRFGWSPDFAWGSAKREGMHLHYRLFWKKSFFELFDEQVSL